MLLRRLSWNMKNENQLRKGFRMNNTGIIESRPKKCGNETKNNSDSNQIGSTMSQPISKSISEAEAVSNINSGKISKSIKFTK